MKVDEGLLFGRGIGFPPVIGTDGRVAWSAGTRNIRESIRIILLTEPKERLMLPHFGAGLQKFFYEPNTITTHTVMKKHITQALERWEPRIKLKSVKVEADSQDPQAAVVTIEYNLVSTGAGDQVTLTIQLAG